MADVQETPVQTEQIPVGQTETQTQTTSEQPNTEAEQAAGTTESVEEEQTQAVEVQTPETPKKYKIVVEGQESELDEAQLIENAQKGMHYTKKMQAISDWEAAQRQKIDFAEQALSNPNAVKMMMAGQLGYDPNMVLGNAQPPPAEWRETYPDLYWQQQVYYDQAQKQKQAFDNTVSLMIQNNAQSANNAAFQKARIKNDLNDSDYEQVKQFVQENMRPNQSGMYGDVQIDAAVNAIVGHKRIEQEKLKQSETIQQNLRKAAQTPAKNKASTKLETLPADVQDARIYKEYVRTHS